MNNLTSNLPPCTLTWSHHTTYKRLKRQYCNRLESSEWARGSFSAESISFGGCQYQGCFFPFFFISVISFPRQTQNPHILSHKRLLLFFFFLHVSLSRRPLLLLLQQQQHLARMLLVTSGEREKNFSSTNTQLIDHCYRAGCCYKLSRACLSSLACTKDFLAHSPSKVTAISLNQ